MRAATRPPYARCLERMKRTFQCRGTDIGSTPIAMECSQPRALPHLKRLGPPCRLLSTSSASYAAAIGSAPISVAPHHLASRRREEPMRLRKRGGRLRALAVAIVTAAGLLQLVAPTAQAAVACSVNYTVASEWDSGFVADVTIKNEGDPISGWTLTWTFPNGQQVTNLWNGSYTQSGAKVTVLAADHNRNIGTGGTANFGFQGMRGATNGKPTDFAVNGTSCAGAAKPTIVATPEALTVKQGGTAKFGVTLASQPPAAVTVAVARSSGSTDLTASPASLTFTTSNWNTPQNVTVSSAANGGDLVTAVFSATATGYTAASVTAKELSATTSPFEEAFLTQYNKIKDPASGYFRKFGDLLVPYHSVETLMVEAPDHGHQTTSEAFSYYLWLEASYGKITGNWAPFKSAWASMEKFIIPAKADQPTNDKYNASKPATYAPEHPAMTGYPSQLDTSIAVGSDPIAAELKTAYGTDDIYGMHWLLDVDNTLGFGRCGDGTTAPSYINTYQRGSSESVWETIPQPSCDTFKHGGPNGYLDLFTKDNSYAKQWKYTNAPDADARAVQVALLASQWATAQGKQAEIAPEVAKAAKMGDYLRYAMFDKYFKKIGNCVGPVACPAGTGKDSDHYLMSWYYAWGGATDTSAGWAWRIGDGASHQGYQNPLAAYALAKVPALKPKSATGQQDWAKSMDRQLEVLQWLQSADGGIAGGVTNSWEGHYGTPPAGTPTFYGMFFDAHPVWRDPPSNRWFGFQVWQLERTASLYQMTGDARAKKILDKWVPWALANTTVGANGAFQIPSDLAWTGAPDTWNPGSPGANANLRVSVLNHSQDVGVAASFAKTLLNYAAKSGNVPARTTGEGLLTALLAHQDAKGIATPETRTDYNRFDDSTTPRPVKARTSRRAGPARCPTVTRSARTRRSCRCGRTSRPTRTGRRCSHT
ncbi:hypothetical protein GCM10009745_52210 [Kribbella yunnanensis]|uniref:CBM2 domain-containing protein n=1 Tax=Kribbella yunnanensis TaxID=190194 RepID=A0ABN2I5X8_9ACTN